MTAEIMRFPQRRSTVILLTAAEDGGWMILAGDHGWLHGDRTAALKDARWLSQNLRLPVREVA